MGRHRIYATPPELLARETKEPALGLLDLLVTPYPCEVHFRPFQFQKCDKEEHAAVSKHSDYHTHNEHSHRG